MRQGVGSFNRTWLAIVGILALLLGTAGLLLASGLGNKVGQALGLPGALAAPTQSVVTPGVQSVFESPAIPAVIATAGMILAILALLWLVKQIPRKNQARPLRLHADGADGLTTCHPQVLTEAISHQVEAFPGVVRSGAVLRGTASSPELTVHATVSDRTDIREVVDYISEHTASDLETALETPLQRLAILLDVSNSSRNNKTIVL